MTAEEANRIGYETAMRWTKGKYAFFVATHTDKAHIHNHIYYNSTSLDCTRKFRDFIGSGRAVRQLSDRICLENDLSVITNPSCTARGDFSITGRGWGQRGSPHIRGSYGLPSMKLSQNALPILTLSSGSWRRPASRSSMGAAVRSLFLFRGRSGRPGCGHLPSGTATIPRTSTVIAGERPLPEQPVLPPAAPRRVNLIVDIQERLRSGKGAAYVRWAKVYTLNRMAAALQFMREQNITEYDQLSAKAEDAVSRFHALTEQLRRTELTCPQHLS